MVPYRVGLHTVHLLSINTVQGSRPLKRLPVTLLLLFPKHCRLTSIGKKHLSIHHRFHHSSLGVGFNAFSSLHYTPSHSGSTLITMSSSITIPATASNPQAEYDPRVARKGSEASASSPSSWYSSSPSTPEPGSQTSHSAGKRKATHRRRESLLSTSSLLLGNRID
jgi:hypothetical protein